MTNKEFTKACVGLRAFDTQEETEREVAGIDEFYRIYRCRYCGKWHIDFDPQVAKNERLSKENKEIDGVEYVPRRLLMLREEKLLRLSQRVQDLIKELGETRKKLKQSRKLLDLYKMSDTKIETSSWIPVDDPEIPLPESEVVCPVVFEATGKVEKLLFGYAYRDEKTGKWHKIGNKTELKVKYWSTPISVKTITEFNKKKENDVQSIQG